MKADRSKYEKLYLAQGYRSVAGLDEVGMGCLAGPVVAAAVVFDITRVPKGIDDSKKLSSKKREELDVEIRTVAIDFAIGIAEVHEIDSINIYHAAKLAMKRAIENLRSPPEFLIIDGRGKIPISIAQVALVKGDQISVSVGAASILAKVYRDKMMRDFDVQYPGYGFASHKGYGSVEHRRALQAKGTTPLHRKSFSWTPVRDNCDAFLPPEPPENFGYENPLP